MGKILTATRWGGAGIIRFIIKHWYLFVLLLIILPTIITSISTAISERNPAKPFLQLGLSIINADVVISEKVDNIKENPSEVIGMEKPTSGIWFRFKYYWMYFINVIWGFFSLIWLITIPFVFLYKVFRIQGSKGLQSSISADFTKALIWGLVFITIVNMIVLIHSLIVGSIILTFTGTSSVYSEMWLIIKNVLPFHGLVKLISYFIIGA